MLSLICAWTNGGVNNRDAADLRRRRAHYDVTVMTHDDRSHGGPYIFNGILLKGKLDVY